MIVFASNGEVVVAIPLHRIYNVVNSANVVVVNYEVSGGVDRVRVEYESIQLATRAMRKFYKAVEDNNSVFAFNGRYIVKTVEQNLEVEVLPPDTTKALDNAMFNLFDKRK